MSVLVSSCVPQVRILNLVYGEHSDGVLYRLQKGWTLHFVLGPTLTARVVNVYCNVSDQSHFKLLKWRYRTTATSNVYDCYVPVQLDTAGSFQYYFDCDGKKCGSGYLLVDPSLHVGPDNHLLPLDAICMQTVLTKLLGKFSSWKSRLQVSKESGYNVIHFTPMQELGCSNSSYSIADQLNFNSNLCDDGSNIAFKDVKKLVEELCEDWSMLSVTDVVWNHTATNSSWLTCNPESGYNLINSPYLRPAYVLDRALVHLALDIEAGKYTTEFPHGVIDNEAQLETLQKILVETTESIKIWEFFQVDIDKELAKFKDLVGTSASDQLQFDATAKIGIIQDMHFRRHGCTIDLQTALVQFHVGSGCDMKKAELSYKSTLQWLNESTKLHILEDMKIAISNVIATVRYERISDHGPKMGSVTKSKPLVTAYFHHPFPDTSVHDEEQAVMENPDKSKMVMAHNGWVMGADALKNFAEYPSKVYFRRELVCWGDSIKLRYGSKPEDSPALWKRMQDYTEQMADVFHGIRIDNCHNTPIHVAEYMLKAARRVRPDLYVFAELFTGNENVDNIFVNRLGITSLIREALAAWNAHEFGRMVYLYGGEPIASFTQPGTQVLKPSRAHALLYDVTHDNESLAQKHSVHDILPSSALVCMASCAIGSNRGHDEMTPHHIHVVTEKRLYRQWSPGGVLSASSITSKTGMIYAKQLLNMLHQTLALNGFSQVFVDQRTPDVIAVTRHNPSTHYSYVMVAYTSFSDADLQELPPLNIEGKIMGIPLEAKPISPNQSSTKIIKGFVKDRQFINGIENYSLAVETDLSVEASSCCNIVHSKDRQSHVIHFTDFPPGSLLVLRVKMLDEADQCIVQIKQVIEGLESTIDGEFDKLASSLSLRALQIALFRCGPEERSDGLGLNTYAIPGWEELCYCGIAGMAIPMIKIRNENDLGHPVCGNLRDGNWYLDYVAARLQKHECTKLLGDWFTACFNILKKVPRYLLPKYFEPLITITYEKLLVACWNKMSPFVKGGGSFVKLLALGSVALCGYVKGAQLPMLHIDIENLCVPSSDPLTQITSSMAAGLPHFSDGVMRCWGRDTFIALRGLLLVTGQHIEARNMILGFAGCLRHGLIPNLLAEGKSPRYNCRDAVWFWLQCIQDYCEINSYQLLCLPVARIFPEDDSEAVPVGVKTQLLYDVIQEALQCHVNGISFRERNAGPNLDQDMSDEGFNVTAGIDLSTGFVFGGSKYNCGTWCDKMGNSEKAGNKGIPATPRDGSAVELVGLCKSTVSWLQRMNNSGKYPYDGVFIKNTENGTLKLTWSEWSNKISANFEKAFYVGDDDQSHLVHKRGIYKDTVGASHPWCDYQLRPNFPIAMVYAPELFQVHNAWNALNIVQDKLLGPLGIKTLDPDDLQYRGDYDNSNDSEDTRVAKGFNYHQGPEWLWPVGYFLKAKLNFAKQLGEDELKRTVHFIRQYLVTHQLHLERSPWCGLPELTNSNGQHCPDSCEIQAWSHASLLDLMYEMSKL